MTAEQTLFSLGTLNTVSGSNLAILLVVQLIKGLPLVKLISTKGLAIVIGVLLFLLISPLPSSLGDFVVILLNGLLSASTAIGGWHLISDSSTSQEEQK